MNCALNMNCDVLFIDDMETMINWNGNGETIGNKSCISGNCIYLGSNGDYIRLANPISTNGYQNVRICLSYIYNYIARNTTN